MAGRDQIYRRLVDPSSDTPVEILDSTNLGMVELSAN